MAWPPERDPREPLGPSERAEERLLTLEKRQLATELELKKHADELRSQDPRWSALADMGIYDLSKHERQAFPDALRYVLGQITAGLRRDASVRFWIAVAGGVGAVTGSFAGFLIQLFGHH